jgi:hypothetical protein
MTSFKSKVLLISILITLTFSITSCSGDTVDKATQISSISVDDTWSISIKKWEIADDLKGTESAMQYNGDVTQIEINETPTAGNTFLLIDLSIEKQKTGSASFVWKNFYIQDNAENKYFRYPNDTFLENYHFPRIKSTDLTIGKNEGFICIEIPKSISKEQLTLTYTSSEGEISIPLR